MTGDGAQQGAGTHAAAPLVHCLTNAVSAPFVADCVAAVGGRPLMAEDPQECAALSQSAQGLCINLGQLTEAKQAAILASLENRGGRPWVLDPVAVGVLPNRLMFAQQLLDFNPSLIRGNASEVYALATGQPSGSGIDSQALGLDEARWHELLSRLPVQEVLVTHASLPSHGRPDGQPGYGDALFLRGSGATGALVPYRGGHPLMGRFPGFGCALSAVCASLGNAAQALELYNLAGRRAGQARVGEFRNAFISHLHKEARRARVRALLRLYFVVGPQDCEDLATVSAQAFSAGVTCVQRREKGAGRGQSVGLAEAKAARLPLIWNDDVARAAGYTGVHLGQGDGAPKAAREALGPDAIIGLSISKPEDWAKYDTRYVDYVGIGPFATTQTKPDARQPLGVAGIQGLRQGYEHVPAVAIGGIDETNAAEALRAGVDGIAVVSAIAKARDPAAATRNLAAIVRSHFDPKS